MELLVQILQFAIWPLCLTMVGLILLQGGSGDVSSAFGGGGQLDTTLGVGASRKMAKLTGVLAAAFFLVVVFLAIPRTKTLAAVMPGANPVNQAAPPADKAPTMGSPTAPTPVEATKAAIVQPEPVAAASAAAPVIKAITPATAPSPTEGATSGSQP